MADFKELVTQLGVDTDSLSKFEAGELEAGELIAKIQDTTFEALAKDKKRILPFVRKAEEETTQKLLKAVTTNFELSEAEYKNKSFAETVQIGLAKKEQEAIDRFKDKTDAELMKTNEELTKEAKKLRDHIARLETKDIPEIKASAYKEVHNSKVDLHLEKFVSSMNPLNAEAAYLFLKNELNKKNYFVDFANNNSTELGLYDNDLPDKSAPLGQGNTVQTLENFAKAALTRANLLVASNAQGNRISTDGANVTSTQSSLTGTLTAPSVSDTKGLAGLKAIQQKRERDAKLRNAY